MEPHRTTPPHRLHSPSHPDDFRAGTLPASPGQPVATTFARAMSPRQATGPCTIAPSAGGAGQLQDDAASCGQGGASCPSGQDAPGPALKAARRRTPSLDHAHGNFPGPNVHPSPRRVVASTPTDRPAAARSAAPASRIRRARPAGEGTAHQPARGPSRHCPGPRAQRPPQPGLDGRRRRSPRLGLLHAPRRRPRLAP